MLYKIANKYLYVGERIETVNRNKAIPLLSPAVLWIVSVFIKQNLDMNGLRLEPSEELRAWFTKI